MSLKTVNLFIPLKSSITHNNIYNIYFQTLYFLSFNTTQIGIPNCYNYFMLQSRRLNAQVRKLSYYESVHVNITNKTSVIQIKFM